MKKTHIAGLSLLSALLLVSFFAFAQKKVIQIFHNGEVVKEYPFDYVDYIEVNEVDDSGDNPGGVIPENPAQAMLDSLEIVYTCFAAPYDGKISAARDSTGEYSLSKGRSSCLRNYLQMRLNGSGTPPYMETSI